MPSRRDPIEEALTELARVHAVASDDAAALLIDALAAQYPAVIARAAVLAGEMELRELEPDLVAAYDCLRQDPEKLDPVCEAMKEVVATLFGFESNGPDVYLHAVRHVQPAGFDNQDVASPLRGLAIQALVNIERPEALTIATDMLTDDEDWARMGAAKALRAIGSQAGAHVLRYKALTGDPSLEVMNECFAAMLEYSPSWVDAVAPYLLSSNDGVATMAALAIAEARPYGALSHLQQAWEEQRSPDTRDAVLQAIASLRSDEAVAYLISLVEGESMTAMQALTALTLYAASESVVEQVRAAATANKRREVYAMFERLFG